MHIYDEYISEEELKEFDGAVANLRDAPEPNLKVLARTENQISIFLIEQQSR